MGPRRPLSTGNPESATDSSHSFCLNSGQPKAILEFICDNNFLANSHGLTRVMVYFPIDSYHKYKYS